MTFSDGDHDLQATDSVVLKDEATQDQLNLVNFFEKQANRNPWVTFNFSSGSSGPPKDEIYVV